MLGSVLYSQLFSQPNILIYDEKNLAYVTLRTAVTTILLYLLLDITARKKKNV